MSQPQPDDNARRASRSAAVSARTHLTVSAVAGGCAAAVPGLLGYWSMAPLAGWDVAATVYMVWIGATVLCMDEEETGRFASREDPGRAMVETLLLLAGAVSLLAVGVALVQAARAQGSLQHWLVGLGVLSVVLSWSVVHTIFALRYARLYYAEPEGGIEFNEGRRPSYMDFAYVAFTIGMTYQVSDTNLTNREVRATALQHALWSYVYGTAIVATTVNLLAGLTSK